jgi:hypothetical protein
LGDIFGPAIYVVVTILLAAAQAVAIVVIAYGFIATAVCVLVGPVFIPFFIVPKMEWLFWGWFRCFKHSQEVTLDAADLGRKHDWAVT